ncbi:MAG: 4-hydroxy-3-methylbut-2-enyl diphosphate reductase [Eubacterium sp.]|nr:4-hydroxy-3-methylbut-2-enyl diphosphate reductase [Eubacterium sp.]
MDVILAKSAGFCFGVKRAVDMAYEEAEKSGEKIYTYGPIIHNEEVVKDLEDRGVYVINSREELEDVKNKTVIIRTHGVAPEIYEIAEKNNINLIDATCPFVLKIHRIVEEYSEKGYTIVIIGNPEHPEVIGIRGWVKNGHVFVCQNAEDIEKFDNKYNEKICIVSQTTFNSKKFKDLVEVWGKKSYTISVVNTICNATEVRQSEASEIAGKVDAMIVIGGLHSSNTQKLYEICKGVCDDTYYIQTLEDFSFREIDNIHTVGITAGASTPNTIIREVQNYVRNEF